MVTVGFKFNELGVSGIIGIVMIVPKLSEELSHRTIVPVWSFVFSVKVTGLASQIVVAVVVTVPASAGATKVIVTGSVSVRQTPIAAGLPSEEVSTALSCIAVLMAPVVKVFAPVTVIIPVYSLHGKPAVALVSHWYIIPSEIGNTKLAKPPTQIVLNTGERGSKTGVFSTIICCSVE